MGEKKKLSEETEVVKVVLELPKEIADFIKDSWATDNLSETLTKEVIQLCFEQLDADASEEDIFPEELIRKHGLMPVFKKFVKQFGITPCYIREAAAK